MIGALNPYLPRYTFGGGKYDLNPSITVVGPLKGFHIGFPISSERLEKRFGGIDGADSPEG